MVERRHKSWQGAGVSDGEQGVIVAGLDEAGLRGAAGFAFGRPASSPL